MEYNKPTTEQKYRTVIEKNTYYFFDQNYEQKYEGYINSLKELLLLLKHNIETQGLKREVFEQLLKDKENGLTALLALTGLSKESLKRLTTIIRVVDDPELSKLVHKEKWFHEKVREDLGEWSNDKIVSLIRDDDFFRKGIVNLFFEGSTVPFLIETFPLFELKKLSLSKLKFEIPEMIDTLIRYKEKGSYSANATNNPEMLIKELLDGLEIPFEKGDLSELVSNAPDNKRTMDFIIPNKKNPQIIAESSFLVTTSSGQGDKSKTEISIDSLLKKHYPESKFIGFVDGIGWYVRKSDLRRMVTAYEDVYTFHKDEIARFKRLLLETFHEKERA